MRVGYLRSCNHLFHSRAFHAERDVVENGVVEKNRLLVHISHKASETVDLHVADIRTVDFYRAAGDVVKPWYQVY